MTIWIFKSQKRTKNLLKTNYSILLGTLLLISLQACEDPVDFRNGIESEKIVVESVISSSLDINYTKLTTSVVVNSQTQDVEEPVNAEVIITDLDNSTDFEFVFDDSRCYSYPGSSFEEGKTYQFNGSVPDSDLMDVFGTTKIPFKTNILETDMLQIDTIYNPDDATRYGLRFEFFVKIDEPVSYPAFYRLIPLLKDYGLDSGGKLFLKSDDIFYFDNFDFINGGNASHDMEHRDGFLINQSKLEDNSLAIIIETYDSLVLGEDRVPKVFFKLQTVEEDYYHYFLSTSKLLKAQASGSSQPVSSYSNITNGHGVFTSYSETIDSFSIN